MITDVLQTDRNQLTLTYKQQIYFSVDTIGLSDPLEVSRELRKREKSQITTSSICQMCCGLQLEVTAPYMITAQESSTVSPLAPVCDLV